VRTYEIKLQLNNAACGRLKRNSRSAVLFYFSFISRCATGLICIHDVF